VAPRRHEGAHIARLEIGKGLQRHLFAAMPGQEGEELAHVALIGLDGLRRHPALRAEMREPAAQFRQHLGRGELQRIALI
jgi:hypothetical protein